MATGYLWDFTLLPETINEITVTQTSTSNSVVLQRQDIGPTESGFTTSNFAETNTVTISATGYQDVENVSVGTSSITMIPAASKPSNLYAWTDPTSTDYPQIVYTAVEKENVSSSGVDVYDNTGNIILAPEKMYYNSGRRVVYDSNGNAHIEWMPAGYYIGTPDTGDDDYDDDYGDDDDDV